MAAETRDDALPEFLARVASPECVDWCAARIGADPEIVAEKIRQYSGEVPVALSLLDGIPLEGRGILDVGAGIGLATFYLHRRGFDVTALEPGGIGFAINETLFLALREFLDCRDVVLLQIGAEELDSNKHGQFDIMFSANVLEHVADLDAVISAMAATLAPGGVMAHTCANYTVPYEPHYRLMLLPFAPAATPWAGKRKTEELWHSLNFITARGVGRLMREAELSPSFAPGVMARSFERLLEDPVFAGRHDGWLMTVARLLKATGGIALLRAWPASLATPMEFRATKHRSATPRQIAERTGAGVS